MKNTVCLFCNKPFTTSFSCTGHQIHCKYNPNRITPWNKGLTKETSSKLQEIGSKIHRTQQSKEWKESTGRDKSNKIRKALSSKKRIAWNKGLTKASSDKLRSIGRSISKTWKEKPEVEKEKYKQTQRIKTLERLINSTNPRFTNTKPERRFKQFLDTIGVTYIQNYPVFRIKHSYPVDFFLPEYNLVIEVDGTYWHNFPCYTEKDLIREEELMREGYAVYRIWEDMIDIIEELPEVFLEYLDGLSKQFTSTIKNVKRI